MPMDFQDYTPEEWKAKRAQELARDAETARINASYSIGSRNDQAMNLLDSILNDPELASRVHLPEDQKTLQDTLPHLFPKAEALKVTGVADTDNASNQPAADKPADQKAADKQLADCEPAGDIENPGSAIRIFINDKEEDAIVAETLHDPENDKAGKSANKSTVALAKAALADTSSVGRVAVTLNKDGFASQAFGSVTQRISKSLSVIPRLDIVLTPTDVLRTRLKATENAIQELRAKLAAITLNSDLLLQPLNQEFAAILDSIFQVQLYQNKGSKAVRERVQIVNTGANQAVTHFIVALEQVELIASLLVEQYEGAELKAMESVSLKDQAENILTAIPKQTFMKLLKAGPEDAKDGQAESSDGSVASSSTGMALPVNPVALGGLLASVAKANQSPETTAKEAFSDAALQIIPHSSSQLVHKLHDTVVEQVTIYGKSDAFTKLQILQESDVLLNISGSGANADAGADAPKANEQLFGPEFTTSLFKVIYQECEKALFPMDRAVKALFELLALAEQQTEDPDIWDRDVITQELREKIALNGGRIVTNSGDSDETLDIVALRAANNQMMEKKKEAEFQENFKDVEPEERKRLVEKSMNEWREDCTRKTY